MLSNLMILLFVKVQQVSRVDGQRWEGHWKSQCWPDLYLKTVYEDQRRVLCKSDKEYKYERYKRWGNQHDMNEREISFDTHKQKLQIERQI